MFQTQRPSRVDDVERRRLQYLAAGWSVAKIERALRQAADSRAHLPPANDFCGFRPDIRRFLASVVGQSKRVAVWIHWEDRAEPIVGGPSQRVPVAELDNFTPEEDCWVWIIAE